MGNLIFFCLYLLLHPKLIRQIIKGLYIPVYIQYEWIKIFKINTVIDVGAYRGHVSKVLKYIFPSADIYAFEPSDEILKLESNKNENITIERSAIGEKKIIADFYRTSYGPASSLLPFGKFYKNTFKVEERKKVNVITLDDYFKNINLRKHIFLKIDTQGMDGSVLRGASKLLKKVSIIHIESPFKELYKGQDFFEDIHEFLSKKNFRFIGNIPDSQFIPNFNPPEVSNCIYINTKLLGKFT